MVTVPATRSGPPLSESVPTVPAGVSAQSIRSAPRGARIRPVTTASSQSVTPQENTSLRGLAPDLDEGGAGDWEGEEPTHPTMPLPAMGQRPTEAATVAMQPPPRRR